MQNYTVIDSKKLHPNRKFDKYLIFTLLLILFHTIGNIIWIYLNNIPFGWDQSAHIIATIKYAHYLKNNVFNIIDFLKLSNYYPIFVYLSGLPLAIISNFNLKVIQFTGTIFFVISIMFLYFYALQLTKNKRLSFLTAFLFSFFITIAQTSRDYMLDLPLTAAVLATLFFEEKLREKIQIKHIYLFFISFAIAQSIKWYAFVYLFIPILFFLCYSIKNNKFRKLINSHFLLGFLLFLILVLPWYLVNYSTIFQQGSFAFTGESLIRPSLFSLDFFFSHLKLIIMFQIHFIGFIVFIISSLFLIKSEWNRKWELVLILIFNYIFFTFIPNKNIRYLIPLMPFFGITIAYGINKLLEAKKPLLISAASFIILYYLISYLILSFGIPVYPKYKHTLNFPILKWVDVYYLADYPVKLMYDSNIWPQQSIVEETLALSDKNKEEIRMLLDVDRLYLNSDNLRLFAVKKRITNLLITSYNTKINLKNEQQIQQYLSNFDFALIPQKNVVGEDKNYIAYRPLLKLQQYFLSRKARNFELIRTYDLPQSQSLIPDSDTLFLYKKKTK